LPSDAAEIGADGGRVVSRKRQGQTLLDVFTEESVALKAELTEADRRRRLILSGGIGPFGVERGEPLRKIRRSDLAGEVGRGDRVGEETFAPVADVWAAGVKVGAANGELDKPDFGAAQAATGQQTRGEAFAATDMGSSVSRPGAVGVVGFLKEPDVVHQHGGDRQFTIAQSQGGRGLLSKVVVEEVEHGDGGFGGVGEVVVGEHARTKIRMPTRIGAPHGGEERRRPCIGAGTKMPAHDRGD